MADLGYRSVEIHVVNDTPAELAVVDATVDSGNASWIAGEHPTIGAVVAPWSGGLWGVFTNDEGAATAASIALRGLGDGQVTLAFANPASGDSTATVTPDDRIAGEVRQVDSGDPNHSLFVITLRPGRR